MGSSISRAVNSHLFKDEQEAQNRKPAMSIFGQGMKNKKKSFDVSDDVGKANRTLRFQSEAGHNEIIGRQKTNNNLPEHKDPERIKLVSSMLVLTKISSKMKVMGTESLKTVRNRNTNGRTIS